MCVSAHVQLLGTNVKDSAQMPMRMDSYRNHITNDTIASVLRNSMRFILFCFICGIFWKTVWFFLLLHVQFFTFIVCSFVRFFWLYISVFYFAIIPGVCLFFLLLSYDDDDVLLLCSCAKWFNLGANGLTNRCAKQICTHNLPLWHRKMPDGWDEEGVTKVPWALWTLHSQHVHT